MGSACCRPGGVRAYPMGQRALKTARIGRQESGRGDTGIVRIIPSTRVATPLTQGVETPRTYKTMSRETMSMLAESKNHQLLPRWRLQL